MRSRSHARKIHGLIAATQTQIHKKTNAEKPVFLHKNTSVFLLVIKLVYVAKILYHLYNKNPVFFSFCAKVSRNNNCIDSFFRKNQACFVNQGRLVLFYLRTMSPFSTSTVIDVTGVSILSMIFSAILSSTLRRILFLRSLAPLVPPTDSFASSATASSV